MLPRDKAVLLQLGGLTAVINADEALFFDNGGEERPRAALRRIGASVEFAFQHYKAPAFELAVLEAVLAEVSSSFQRRRDLYEPVVQKQLREASCEFDGFGVDGLHRLSAFDGALMSFEAETRQALQVLDELLASDEDMLGLLLSERRAALRGSGAPRRRRAAAGGLPPAAVGRRRRRRRAAGQGPVGDGIGAGDDRFESEQHHQVRCGEIIAEAFANRYGHRADAV